MPRDLFECEVHGRDSFCTLKDLQYLAGKVFQRYRAAGGTRNGVLPDFFISAHAAVAGLPLLTRDLQRYRTYFPSLSLIAPQTR